MKNRVLVSIARSLMSFMILVIAASTGASQSLTLTDVQNIIAQAVSKAVAMNQKVTVSVSDKEGNLLGTFQMTGAPAMTLIRSVGRAGQGLENLSVSSTAAAQSKAGTAGLLSSGGNAFTTRTASFIIQEHFPPGIDNTPGGPLYGVQFSTLPCSDVAIAGQPLGLSGDPGGLPLYKNGVAVGGIGVESNGLYTVDRDPADDDLSPEESIAAYGQRGFEPPDIIKADNILVAGIRLPYANPVDMASAAAIAFGSLPGTVTTGLRAAPVSDFVSGSVNGVSGQFSSRFPTIAGSNLTAAEVTQALGVGIDTANRVRAAIRQPIGSNTRVTVAVTDVDGKVLGIFRSFDAPVFGLDVAVQKARTSGFFARTDAGSKLTTAGFGSYVTRASSDGIALNGSVAFSDRAIGFLHRPLFPDGINDTAAGPFSTQLADWSPFNNGLQLDLVKNALTSPPMVCSSAAIRRRRMMMLAAPCPCTAVAEMRNGAQIFAGGLPIYRGSTYIGAVGVSGDGIEQDDIIAAFASGNFAPATGIRSDNTFVRTVRLPFLKFPARPFLDSLTGVSNPK
jgi:uncharacterized protein GlcG (DUF336 family)